MSMLAYWGDLRLPKVLRRTEITAAPDQPQVHKGLDREDALILPVNRNWTTKLTARTFWPPEADFTRESFEAYEAVFLEAVKARSETAWPYLEVLPGFKVTAYSSPTATAVGHTFVNGDVILGRRLLIGGYVIGAVSNVSGNDFDLLGLSNGDDVFKIHRYWSAASLVAPPALRYVEKQGGHFAADASTQFVANSVIVPNRTVDLDG